MFLLAGMATALLVAANLRQRSAQQFGDQRMTNAIAQEALINLQTTGKATTRDESAKISVDRSGKRLGDAEWVEVRIVRGGRHASITGLVRNGGAP
jgi:hypothetical protein